MAARAAASEAISTVLRERARRQEGAELRVRPRHLPHRPVVPAIAEARPGQPRAASTEVRRATVRPCIYTTVSVGLAHPFRSATCLRSPPSMTS